MVPWTRSDVSWYVELDYSIVGMEIRISGLIDCGIYRTTAPVSRVSSSSTPSVVELAPVSVLSSWSV